MYPGKADGHPIDQMYRLIDIERGSDLEENCPKELQEIHSGDYFDDPRARKSCMLHTAKGEIANKYLLSFSKTMQGVTKVLESKQKHPIDRNPDKFLPPSRQIIASFCMVTAWFDKEIDRNSYADVSTERKWLKYMKGKGANTDVFDCAGFCVGEVLHRAAA